MTSVVLPFFNLRDHQERVWGLGPRTRSFKVRNVLSFCYLRLDLPIFRLSLGWYTRTNLGSRIVSIPFWWSNQFFHRPFKSSTMLSIFSLFRTLEFIWRSNIFSSNSDLKNPVFSSVLKAVPLNKKPHLRVAILMADFAWHKPQKWRNVNIEHYKSDDWQGELKLRDNNPPQCHSARGCRSKCR